MKEKILVITPKFPWPLSGACEIDRSVGIERLLGLGFDVAVISKISDGASRVIAEEVAKKLNIAIDVVSYKFLLPNTKYEKFKRALKRIINPLFWDGSSFEYFDSEIQELVKSKIESWQPDIVWFDYTFLWPLYKFPRNKGTPIITRSSIFDPFNLLEEDGMRPANLLRFVFKMVSEFLAVKKSNFIFSITPNEEKIYRFLGAEHVVTLPLRGLARLLKSQCQLKEDKILHLFFMGSTYNVHHNKKAVEFLLTEVAPELEKRYPGGFKAHILGAKLPTEFERFLNERVVYEGYVENLEEFLIQMDVAVMPSIFGAGMQQKIFEPLSRGIPTVTSPRGIAGYPFKSGEHLFFARTKEDYADQIIKLRDINLRKKISRNSLKLCRELFSQDRLDNLVLAGINTAKEFGGQDNKKYVRH